MTEHMKEAPPTIRQGGRSRSLAGSHASGRLNPMHGEGEAWSRWLRAAVAMGIAPEAFWRLSWREWRMLTAQAAVPVLERADFNALMARFPDDMT